MVPETAEKVFEVDVRAEIFEVGAEQQDIGALTAGTAGCLDWGDPDFA